MTDLVTTPDPVTPADMSPADFTPGSPHYDTPFVKLVRHVAKRSWPLPASQGSDTFNVRSSVRLQTEFLLEYARKLNFKNTSARLTDASFQADMAGMYTAFADIAALRKQQASLPCYGPQTPIDRDTNYWGSRWCECDVFTYPDALIDGHGQLLMLIAATLESTYSIPAPYVDSFSKHNLDFTASVLHSVRRTILPRTWCGPEVDRTHTPLLGLLRLVPWCQATYAVICVRDPYEYRDPALSIFETDVSLHAPPSRIYILFGPSLSGNPCDVLRVQAVGPNVWNLRGQAAYDAARPEDPADTSAPKHIDVIRCISVEERDLMSIPCVTEQYHALCVYLLEQGILLQ